MLWSMCCCLLGRCCWFRSTIMIWLRISLPLRQRSITLDRVWNWLGRPLILRFSLSQRRLFWFWTCWQGGWNYSHCCCWCRRLPGNDKSNRQKILRLISFGGFFCKSVAFLLFDHNILFWLFCFGWRNFSFLCQIEFCFLFFRLWFDYAGFMEK